ncbi:MAG: nitrilase-related carbon-nitrogen hydrolase [Planctomycetota bacterium]
MANEQTDTAFDAACIQCDIAPGDVEGNFERIEVGLREAAEAGAQLMVLPEMWTTSFVDSYDDDLLDRAVRAETRVAALSAELDCIIVGGGPARDGIGVSNRANVFDRGAALGTYRKIHLFSPIAEHKRHVAGNRPLILDTRLGRLGVVLCYDLRFPELVRHYFVERCDVLLVPAQWPEARADHWRVLLRARAIENQCYVIGCNRAGVEDGRHPNADHLLFPGDSRIVDPTGTVIAAGSGEAKPVLGHIELRTVRSMRRIVPIAKDRRPEVYSQLWKTPEPD